MLCITRDATTASKINILVTATTAVGLVLIASADCAVELAQTNAADKIDSLTARRFQCCGEYFDEDAQGAVVKVADDGEDTHVYAANDSETAIDVDFNAVDDNRADFAASTAVAVASKWSKSCRIHQYP